MRSVALGLILGVALGFLTEALTWTTTPGDDEPELAPITTVATADEGVPRG